MTDAPGTCHLVGCPGKGKHPPHGIGCPDDFAAYAGDRCLGTPEIVAAGAAGPGVEARCSLDGTWRRDNLGSVGPQQMASLVDQHRADCPNRRAR